MFCVETEVPKEGLQQGQVHASMLAVILLAFILGALIAHLGVTLDTP